MLAIRLFCLLLCKMYLPFLLLFCFISPLFPQLSFGSPLVRSQTSASRSSYVSPYLRGAYVDRYERRAMNVAMSEKRYQDDLAKWRARVQRENYEKIKREVSEIRRRDEIREKEKRRILRYESRKLASKNSLADGSTQGQLTRGTSADREPKKTNFFGDVKGSIFLTDPNKARVNGDIATANRVSTPTGDTRRKWSFWWGEKTTEKSDQNRLLDNRSEPSSFTTTNEDDAKSQRSLWGHLKRALW